MMREAVLEPAAHDERRELAAVAAEFAARELRPRAELLDRGDEATWREAWDGCVGLGLDRALVTEEHGGAGLDARAFLLILSALAAGEAGVAYCVLAHNLALATLPAVDLPGPAERWVVSVPPLGMPDRGAVRATPGDGSVILDGRTPVVLGAGGAQGVVIYCHPDAASNGAQATTCAITLSSPGVACELLVEQLGLRTARAAVLEFESAIAKPLDELAAAHAECRALFLRGVTAIAAGVAEDAFERARGYAAERRQSGGPIARFDAVKHLLANLRLAAELGHAALGSAVSEVQALAMKIAVTEAALSAAIDAVQVFGGYGYMVDQGIEKLMRDAEYLRLVPEPNRVARLALGDAA